jgi:hypothetical protein
MSKQTYDHILTQVRRLTSHPDTKEQTGESFIDVPADKIIVRTMTYWPTEAKRIHINATTADALPAFSWHAEITVDDREAGQYSHFLLQTDGEIVETYGKQVYPVDEATATKLADELDGLSS